MDRSCSHTRYHNGAVIAVIAAWLNASQISRNGDDINGSARVWSVNRIELSQGLHNALYKNVPVLPTDTE